MSGRQQNTGGATAEKDANKTTFIDKILDPKLLAGGILSAVGCKFFYDYGKNVGAESDNASQESIGFLGIRRAGVVSKNASFWGTYGTITIIVLASVLALVGGLCVYLCFCRSARESDYDLGDPFQARRRVINLS